MASCSKRLGISLTVKKMQHRGLQHVDAEHQDERTKSHGSPVQARGDQSDHTPGEIGESHLDLEIIALAEIPAHPHRIAAMKHGMTDE